MGTHCGKTSLSDVSNLRPLLCRSNACLSFATIHLVLITLAIFPSCSLVEATAKLRAPDWELAETQAPSVTGRGGRKKRHGFKQCWLSLVSVAHFQLPDWFDSGGKWKRKKLNCVALLLWARARRNPVKGEEDTLTVRTRSPGGHGRTWRIFLWLRRPEVRPGDRMSRLGKPYSLQGKRFGGLHSCSSESRKPVLPGAPLRRESLGTMLAPWVTLLLKTSREGAGGAQSNPTQAPRALWKERRSCETSVSQMAEREEAIAVLSYGKMWVFPNPT